MATSSSLKILQYNTHLFLGSPAGKLDGDILYEDERRIQGIVDKINQSDYDIVCLEEVWGYPEKDKIVNAVVSKLPFFQMDDYSQPAQGSGLLVLSRIPIHPATIDRTTVKPFTKFNHLTGSDWFSQKGFITVLLAYPGQESEGVWLIATHTQASYDKTAVADRASNLKQISDQVKFLQANFPQPVIVVGDLNVIAEDADSGKETEEYQFTKNLFSETRLSDAFRTLHSYDSSPGVTYDGAKNTLISRFAPEDKGAKYRLDYAFVGPHEKIKPTSGKVATDYTYTDPETNAPADLSDHYPLELDLELS